jgi:DNA-binding transcriptional LysR family regulator
MTKQMDEFGKIRAFIEAVERGGFSAAARQADVAVSSIARQVKALEEELGTRLINRTTRSQSLTEAGRLYYERMHKLLREFDSAKREVQALQTTIGGTLTVTIRTSSSGMIIPALPSFLSKHPNLVLDLSVTDERRDLISDGVDIAVWLGEMHDSTLVGRRLTPSRRLVCGSPSYFVQNGIPTYPEQLADHNCLIYRANQYGDIWKFVQNGKTTSVAVKGNLRTATGSVVLLGSAIAGLGLILIQEFHAGPALKSGALQAIFQDYEISPTDEDTSLYLVYPSSRSVTPAARAFIDFLVELFSNIDKAMPSGLN